MPRVTNVNPKKAGTSSHASKQLQTSRQRRPILPPLANPAAEEGEQTAPGFTLGELAWQNRAWPRWFDLPGIRHGQAYPAEELCAHLALAFHGFTAELHELVATAAQTRPAAAAALAEAVAILEQCACMEGIATALDDIPSNGESPALRLAALAKVQALNRRPSSKPPGTKGGARQ